MTLKIAFIGDLTYSRTVHSLIETLTHFDNEIFLVSPQSLRTPPDFIDELDARGTVYTEDEDFFSIASDVESRHCPATTLLARRRKAWAWSRITRRRIQTQMACTAAVRIRCL